MVAQNVYKSYCRKIFLCYHTSRTREQVINSYVFCFKKLKMEGVANGDALKVDYGVANGEASITVDYASTTVIDGGGVGGEGGKTMSKSIVGHSV